MTTENSVVYSDFENEKVLQPSYKDQIESLDLEYLKKLHEAASKANQELEELKVKLKNQESKVAYTNGAASSFSEYIQLKYKLERTDSIDLATGFINRT